MLVKPQTETTLEHKKSKNITRYFFKLLLLTVNPKKKPIKNLLKQTLREDIRLNITIVVFTSPHETTI